MAAYIAPEGAAIDPLETYEPTTILGGNLRPGMVLLDDLNTPAAVVDHRIAERNGIVRYLLEDLDRGGWTETPFLITSTLTVAASAA